MSVYNFVDEAVNYLKPGGQLLVGDIHILNKCKIFFVIKTGIVSHKAFVNSDEQPQFVFFEFPTCAFDDSIILSDMFNLCINGFEAYTIPLVRDLPMASRKEDMLIVKRN